MIIVQCDVEMKDWALKDLHRQLCDMKKEGLLLLPSNCHLVQADSEKDPDLKLVPKEEEK